ncbi:predicted protein [Uncinocarpus reesii 1704]|uniref:Autophagy-related protein 33 n=1 Tax=Uncinocarpus reesii (strain UAMH 1704) TaxID=336963 RepID=C4JN62_UNCRE|nr:uncharacterized protein UREG_04270 [Uncinocarpus reesii 1704]EEP79424.1 predicted protein [Uncinocarpus reesii 1704]
MACPITVAKFVGTVSLGLLTGLSYSVSTVTIPALQLLPTANDAAQVLRDVQLRTRRRVLTLSNITAVSLLAAFTLSSPRRKHPYLVWTSLVALLGGTGLEFWFIRDALSSNCLCPASFCGSVSALLLHPDLAHFSFGSFIAAHLGCSRIQVQNDRRREEEESNGNGSEIEIVEESEAVPTPTTREQSATPEPADMNGESVRADMEKERKIQKIRAWVVGVAFSMGVVGIWGDGI